MAAALMGWAPLTAWAHTGAENGGLQTGFLHPFSGVDHILVMVAVGLWAAQRGGRLSWGVPALFVFMMVAGGIVGGSGLPVPMVEPGLALSVVLMGLLVAWPRWIGLAPGLALIGVFALIHGYAHGAALLAGAPEWSPALGFVLATLVLHGAGVTLAKPAAIALTNAGGGWSLLRAGGLACSMVGVVLLGGMMI